MDRLQDRVGRGGEHAASGHVVGLVPDGGDGKWDAAVDREEVGEFPDLRPLVEPIGGHQASPLGERGFERSPGPSPDREVRVFFISPSRNPPGASGEGGGRWLAPDSSGSSRVVICPHHTAGERSSLFLCTDHPWHSSRRDLDEALMPGRSC